MIDFNELFPNGLLNRLALYKTLKDFDSRLSALPDVYDVTVTVMDESNNLVNGASVTVDDVVVVTGSDGVASFENLLADDYTVNVTADGFDDYTGSITVDATHLSFNVSLTAVIPVYDVVITVDDGTNPIEGASVVIGETTKTTDANGECTFDDLEADTYSAEISKEGYTTATESISVDESHTSFTISLTAIVPTSTVYFAFKNENDSPYTDSRIYIDDIEVITDVNGEVEINLPYGTYALNTAEQALICDPISITVDSETESFNITVKDDF